MLKIVEVVRTVVGKDAVLFNDRLKDGTRSVKVWGWSIGAANAVAVLLRQQGRKVRLVETRLGEFRLHVKPAT